MLISQFHGNPSRKMKTSNVLALLLMTLGALVTRAVSELTAVNANGVGAGTTAYLNAGQIPSNRTRMVFMLQRDTSFDTKIMSYTSDDGQIKTSSLTTFTVNADNSLTIAPPLPGNVLSDAQIKAGTMMTDSTAVFLTVDHAYNVFAIMAKISGTAATLLPESKIQITEGSATNTITRISDTQFAAAYILKWEPTNPTKKLYREVVIGTIDLNANKISISAPAQIGPSDEITNMHPTSFTGEKDHFVVPWYENTYDPSFKSRLCFAVYNISGNAPQSVVDICRETFSPVQFADITPLSSPTKLAAAFYDTQKSKSLTVVTMQSAGWNVLPIIRSTVVFDDVTCEPDFGVNSFFFLTPKIVKLDNNRLAIVFFDTSAQGKLSVKFLRYSEDHELSIISSRVAATPKDFTLHASKPLPNPWDLGSVTFDAVATPKGIALAYAGVYDLDPVQGVSVVETLGSPVGVKGPDGTVVKNGAVTTDGLTSGAQYYAATNGRLVPVSSASDGKSESFYSDDGKLVVGKDGKVGVATSSNQLTVTL